MMSAKANKKRAVVLLSGGLDSATTLAIARDAGHDCYALSIDYGQRHRIELEAAARVAASLGVVEHRTMRIDLGGIGGSALTDPTIAVPETAQVGIPATYVPARNTVMLSFALGWAEVLAAPEIFVGVNAVDYSGYPDCRPAFIAAFEKVANLATKIAVEGVMRFSVNAPLISMTKAQIIQRGVELGVDYSLTISCYQADGQGQACGRCDSCRLRREGFAQAGVPDPTKYAALA